MRLQAHKRMHLKTNKMVFFFQFRFQSQCFEKKKKKIEVSAHLVLHWVERKLGISSTLFEFIRDKAYGCEGQFRHFFVFFWAYDQNLSCILSVFKGRRNFTLKLQNMLPRKIHATCYTHRTTSPVKACDFNGLEVLLINRIWLHKIVNTKKKGYLGVLKISALLKNRYEKKSAMTTFEIGQTFHLQQYDLCQIVIN